MQMICLSCTGSTVKQNLSLIEKNRSYIDLVEIRADFLIPEEYTLLKTMPDEAELPCLLTFRKPADGGCSSHAADLSAGQRCDILSDALDGRWSYIDLEDDADAPCEKELMRKAESAGVRIIKSFHDFKGVPENLAERMLENSCGDRYIPKAAVMPGNTADLLRLLKAYRTLEDVRKSSAGFSCTNGPFISDFILVGMGVVGFPSRILAGSYGSMLTFCSDGDVKAAPGHISPRELAETYNYKNINSSTRLFGIVGQPVMHTKSPMLHNEALQRKGIDAVYLPFETGEPELLLAAAEDLKLYGLSVTIPHKQRVIRAADSVDEAVEKVGACNTLVYRRGAWRGYNTDWIGFLKPLDELTAGFADGKKAGLEGEPALVIGAGGASRAVVYALRTRGMDITIVNRTAEKAEALARDFDCSGLGIEDAYKAGVFSRHYRLVVQTTSVGMEPLIDQSPLPDFDFGNADIVYDLIYSPEKTLFLSQAEKGGAVILNGFPMLKAQAAEQFRLFTGRDME